MTDLGALQRKRELYWQQVEEALKAAGMTVEPEERGIRLAHRGEREDACALRMKDQQQKEKPYGFTGRVELKAQRAPYVWKNFPELKAGGFNLKSFVEYVAGEVDRHRRRRNTEEALAAGIALSREGLEGIAERLRLPTRRYGGRDNEIEKVAGVASPASHSGVDFRFSATIEQAERVLVLLLELGIIEREDSDA